MIKKQALRVQPEARSHHAQRVLVRVCTTHLARQGGGVQGERESRETRDITDSDCVPSAGFVVVPGPIDAILFVVIEFSDRVWQC